MQQFTAGVDRIGASKGIATETRRRGDAEPRKCVLRELSQKPNIFPAYRLLWLSASPRLRVSASWRNLAFHGDLAVSCSLASLQN